MCWHKFGEWVTIKEGDLVRKGTQVVIGYGLIQTRVCEKCGLKELDEQSRYL